MRLPPPPTSPFSLGLIGKDHLMVLDGNWKDSKLEVVLKSNGEIGWNRLGHIHKKAE